MFGRNDKFEELVSKITEALANRQSDPLLLQHLADCVRRQDKIDDTLMKQNEAALAMHKENQEARERDRKDQVKRFISLLIVFIAAMLPTFLGKLPDVLKLVVLH